MFDKRRFFEHAAAAHSTIFTRYTRGMGEKEGGSSGLGLAFCRLAVEAHGGTMMVMSVPQQGTAFSIRLPLVAAEQESA